MVDLYGGILVDLSGVLVGIYMVDLGWDFAGLMWWIFSWDLHAGF